MNEGYIDRFKLIGLIKILHVNPRGLHLYNKKYENLLKAYADILIDIIIRLIENILHIL